MLEKGSLRGIKQASELWFSFHWLKWWRASFSTSLWEQDSLGLSSHTSGQTDPKPLGPAIQVSLLHSHVCGEVGKRSASDINLSIVASWTKVSGLFVCRGGPDLGKQEKKSAVEYFFVMFYSLHLWGKVTHVLASNKPGRRAGSKQCFEFMQHSGQGSI